MGVMFQSSTNVLWRSIMSNSVSTNWEADKSNLCQAWIVTRLPIMTMVGARIVSMLTGLTKI